MRTIKFRGKSAYSDKWCYGSLVFYEEEGEAEIHGIDIYRVGDEVWQKTNVYPSTVGQFTGLCDDDGKEIYEGDLIETCGVICEVQYNCVIGAFVLAKSGLRRLRQSIGKTLGLYNCTVVDNIYDNPELLKGGQHDNRERPAKTPSPATTSAGD